jgi:excisionase family DNA binding protein
MSSQLEPLLTINEAADVLGISRSQVYLMLRRGELPYTRVGERIRFVPAELREYLDQQKESQ